jgi:hypothetical protein
MHALVGGPDEQNTLKLFGIVEPAIVIVLTDCGVLDTPLFCIEFATQGTLKLLLPHRFGQFAQSCWREIYDRTIRGFP